MLPHRTPNRIHPVIIHFWTMVNSKVFYHYFLEISLIPTNSYFYFRLAYIFILLNKESRTRGKIIFIHFLCVTVLFSLSQSKKLPRYCHTFSFSTQATDFTDFAGFSICLLPSKVGSVLFTDSTGSIRSR